MDEAIHRSTPKGISEDGVASTPSAYKIIKLECLNQYGTAFDISKIVTSFSIVEEMFSPILVLSLKVRDDKNFFEDFALSGQEKIKIQLEHFTKSNQPKNISLEFLVKEYPNYQKSIQDSNVQNYTVLAVSGFAGVSMLTRISRSIKGNPLDNIKKIFNDDLGAEVEIKSDYATAFDGIITIQTPLKAVEWIRSKTFDVYGSPYFIFSNITSDKVKIASLVQLWKADTYKKYNYMQYCTTTFSDPKYFDEQASRILDIRSNIKIDKLSQAAQGSFTSSNVTIDLATKTFTPVMFTNKATYLSKPNAVRSIYNLSKNLVLGKQQSADNLATDLMVPNISNLSVNSNSNYAGNPNSTSGPTVENIANAKAYFANLEAISHHIQIYGDFDFNAGKKISINIPKSINPDEVPDDASDMIDKSLSGNYLVAVAAHTFVDGVYTIKAKVIKDTL